jgi:hypothetical protein
VRELTDEEFQDMLDLCPYHGPSPMRDYWIAGYTRAFLNWVNHPETVLAKQQWNKVAALLGADQDCPDSVIAAAERLLQERATRPSGYVWAPPSAAAGHGALAFDPCVAAQQPHQPAPTPGGATTLPASPGAPAGGAASASEHGAGAVACAGRLREDGLWVCEPCRFLWIRPENKPPCEPPSARR